MRRLGRPLVRTRAVRFVFGTVDVDLALVEKTLRSRAEAPTADNLKLAITTLDTLLGRLIVAKQQLDTKAALIIPAIGAIGGLAADRSASNLSAFAALTGGAAIVAAATAVIFAIVAVWPVGHVVGPGPELTALKTSTPDPLKYGQAIVDGLALAVVATHNVMLTKANRLNRSLLFAAAAVILLLLYVGVGGWK